MTALPAPEADALCLRVADLLSEREAFLAERVSARCFRELASYRQLTMPRHESQGTVEQLLQHLVACLRQESVGSGEQVEFAARTLHSGLLRLEQGIAARRVQLAIELEDLLRGAQIARQELWRLLAEELPESERHSEGFWELQRRIQDVFDRFFIGLTSSYLASQRDLMAQHESSLAQWEEVVRSASHIRLKVPCREEYAATVRLQAEAIARRVDFGDEEIYDIITAVGEVCDNAIEHGRSELGVDIEYSLTPEVFRIEVRDFGPGFDPQGRGEEPPDVLAESGRGIFLMRRLMDGLEIESASGQGARVVLIKRRSVPASSGH